MRKGAGQAHGVGHLRVKAVVVDKNVRASIQTSLIYRFHRHVIAFDNYLPFAIGQCLLALSAQQFKPRSLIESTAKL